MSHANALLTPRTRLRLAQLIVESGWTYSAAAKMFMVSPRTARKWADRYRAEGVAGMADRSSRPHHSPSKTPQRLVKQIVRLRWRRRLGPVQIAGILGMLASTVHAVLVRCRINRLWRPLPAADEREDRTAPPHPWRWLGLRPLLRLRSRAPRRPARMAALLQSPQAPQRDRQPSAGQPADQPPWTSQLAPLPHLTRSGFF